MREHNYGIDLLRLLAMFMICTLHICGQGLAMVRTADHMGTYYALWILETASYCAVNIYGLISGYVGVRSRHRISRFFELWLTVFWYAALGTLVAVMIFKLPVKDDTVLKALFPTLWKTYWYFSAYAGVFFIAPFINKMVLALTDKERKSLILVIVLICAATMIPRVSQTGTDFLTLGAGYSFVWLALLYAAGACLREMKMTELPGWLYLVFYAGLILFSWAFKIVAENLTYSLYGEYLYGRMFTSYTSPTIFLAAVCLVMYFKSVKVHSAATQAVIRFLTPMAFSVYLVQVQPYFWEYVLKSSCYSYRLLNPVMAVCAVLLSAAALYGLCTAIDLVRRLVFRIVNVRGLLKRAAEAVGNSG